MLKGGAFPEPAARSLFRQILGAIKACHTFGVFHRDIKPDNILVALEEVRKIPLLSAYFYLFLLSAINFISSSHFFRLG